MYCERTRDRNAFNTVAKGGKVKGKPEIARAVDKILKTAEVSLSAVNGVTQEEVVETVAELAERVEGKEVTLDFDSLLSYIESYATDNDDVIFGFDIDTAQKENAVAPRQKAEEGGRNMLLDPRECEAEAKLSRTIENQGRAEEELVPQLETSIKQYDELMQQQIRQGKDTTATRDLIALLTKQLSEYRAVSLPPRPPPAVARLETGSKASDDRGLNVEQLRDNGLKEIFYFYCKQQYMPGRKPTFDQLYTFSCNMTIGEFMKFCKDFRVPLKASKIKELFKRYAKLSKELDFDCFLVLVPVQSRCR